MKQRPLNTRQKKFLENHLIKGMSIAESVRRAGYSIKSGRSEDYSSWGCRILKTPRVASEVQKIREKAFSREALSYAEKRAFLARAVRTSVGEIHEGSDLAQEVTITEGKEGTSRRVKAVDKLRALELDSKLAGDFYSDREPQANNNFLFLVNLGKAGIGNALPVALPSPVSQTTPVIETQAETLAD